MQLFAAGTRPFFPAICRFGVEGLPRQLRRQRIFRLFVFAGSVLALFAGQACQKRDKPPAIVLTLIDQGWWVNKEARDRLNEELRLFTT